MDESTDFGPPPGPPPILSAEEIIHLASQGHLSVSLPPALEQACAALFTVASEEFFIKSTDEKKKMYPAQKGEELGYVNIEGEKEFLTLRHVSQPTTDSPLTPSFPPFYTHTHTLLSRILTSLSLGLSLSPTTFSPLLPPSTLPLHFSTAYPSFTRLFTYLPNPNSISSAPHRDLGLLTLCVGDGPGLQVWAYDEERGAWDWRDTVGPTVLVGSALRMLTGGRVREGIHRVVGTSNVRRSVSFSHSLLFPLP
ncbi:MAG: hypothetical protein Q9227_006915 [Pyrenula ochraceoflavens]